MRVQTADRNSSLARFGQRGAEAGLVLYAVFAPHSIAAAEISLAIVGAGWLVRSLATRSTGFQRTRLDLPISLFLLWTIASSLLSEEPQISIGKLQSVCVVFLFYLTQSIVRRQTAVILVSVMILSGVAGSLYSIYDLLRGRGVMVESVSIDSPFREAGVRPGDTIWRVANHRVYSKSEIDEQIRQARAGERLPLSLITEGEHAERFGAVITPELQSLEAPAGITGSERSHRFRASGWTRHYETFAEILQMLAQLALGLALSNLLANRFNPRFRLAALAAVMLAIGTALTAMRTALVALALGAALVTVRAARAGARLLVAAGIMLVLAFGALIVWQTRPDNALSFDDASSSLRAQVARVGVSRLLVHPVLGHGMDAVKKHWSEWGFPGKTLIHLHSTPLQIAFDRGLPALLFWLWIMFAAWRITERGELLTRDLNDPNRHGVLLGAMGALAGFFASSLVNYNFGDGEVALVFWWLLGIVVVLVPEEGLSKAATRSPSRGRNS